MEPATHRKLSIIIAGFASLGALVSILAYFENRRQNEMKRELMTIEKEIKELELVHKRNNLIV